MELPYLEPLTPRPLADPVIPEPPRRGEPGGEECGICTHQATPAVWESEHFTMHPPVQGSLPAPSGWPARSTSTRSRTSRRRRRPRSGR